ncbi:MAG: TetR/AcrR family transcriptional regulator [Tahibacter sp.]
MSALAADVATRTRLMEAALILFRQRGFHGVGIAEILRVARAPKGSLYHHFPGGKVDLAVAVVQNIESRLQQLFAANASFAAPILVRNIGNSVWQWMRRAGGDACALLASFAAEGDTDPALRAAVGHAYRTTTESLRASLQRDGWSPGQARDRAGIVLALFEGAGLVSHARGEPRLFSTAIRHAVRVCEREGTF